MVHKAGTNEFRGNILALFRLIVHARNAWCTIHRNDPGKNPVYTLFNRPTFVANQKDKTFFVTSLTRTSSDPAFFTPTFAGLTTLVTIPE